MKSQCNNGILNDYYLFLILLIKISLEKNNELCNKDVQKN